MGNKSKEEQLREKAINRSLTTLSKSTQEIGVISIQKNDNVFFLGEKKYIKIYSMKSVLNSRDMKQSFLNVIENTTSNRMRISVFCKNTELKSNIYMFITVYFEAEDYVGALKEIRKFENGFIEQAINQLGLNITECKLHDVFSIIYMNSSGKVKRFQDADVFSAKANWNELLLGELKSIHYGNFECNEQHGKCYIAKEFPNKELNINTAYTESKGNVYCCIDIQTMTEEERQILEYEIKNKYNSRTDATNQKVVNVSYLVAVSAVSEDVLTEMSDTIEAVFESNDMLLLPCSGREEIVFKSICSLGLCDFHSMQNVSPAVVSGLLF